MKMFIQWSWEFIALRNGFTEMVFARILNITMFLLKIPTSSVSQNKGFPKKKY